MARMVESNHAFIEQLAYLISPSHWLHKSKSFTDYRYQLKCKVSDQKIGALMALAKVQAGKVVEYCAREASQILGGNSCLRGGKGERIERMYPLSSLLFLLLLLLFVSFLPFPITFISREDS